MLTLQPRLMAADIFESGVAVVSHLPLSPGPWAPIDPGLRNALSGGFLPLAGNFPVVCAAAVATPEILDLMEESGLPRPTRLHTFRDSSDYLPTLARVADSGRAQLAMQHPHPPGEVAPGDCLVDPTLLAKLADKAHLDDLFSPGQLLERSVLTALPENPGTLLSGGPAVLKAATGEANGGGSGVRPARSLEEAATACRELAAGPRWVLEAYADFERSVCVHTAVLRNGCAIYLGAAEQVFKTPFLQSGNWVDAQSEVPETVVRCVLAASERAGSWGYRGFAGFDVGFCLDGTWAVVDGNFRLNASTTTVLLREAIFAASGFDTLRLSRWTSNDFPTLLARAREFADLGYLVPLWAYDPSAGAHGGQAILQGIVCGASRTDVESRMAELNSGLSGH